MPKCPSCGSEVNSEDQFCWMCGTKISEEPSKALQAQEEVKQVLIRRLDALTKKDERTLLDSFDRTLYTRFDDWPPPNRQESDEALKNEIGGMRALANYAYEIKDLKIQVLGDVALATFHLYYRGRMRERSFDIWSRVTTVLRKDVSTWKIVHEHYSRFS